jgi:hypothetical protein
VSAHTRPAPLLLAATLALASCGGQQLDTGKAENAIKTGITQQTGVQVGSVECPNEVELKQGNNFQCTATDARGNKAPVGVTQTDDQGNINWKLNPQR